MADPLRGNHRASPPQRVCARHAGASTLHKCLLLFWCVDLKDQLRPSPSSCVSGSCRAGASLIVLMLR
jgi:hypothetical protein